MTAITLDQAIEIAEIYLNGEIRDAGLFKDSLFVIERDLTRGFDDYWIFFYQTDSYLRSGDVLDALVGNLPIKISKDGVVMGFVKHSELDQAPLAK